MMPKFSQLPVVLRIICLKFLIRCISFVRTLWFVRFLTFSKRVWTQIKILVRTQFNQTLKCQNLLTDEYYFCIKNQVTHQIRLLIFTFNNTHFKTPIWVTSPIHFFNSEISCHLHRHYHHNFPCHSHYSYITKIMSPNQLPHNLMVKQCWHF